MTSVVVSGQTTQFAYDPDGNLLAKVKPDGSATLYLGGLYKVDLTSVGVTTKKTTYYPGGVMRVDIVGGSNTLYYTLKDHPSTSLRTSLGSASTLLDTNGNIVANGEQRYYPFGESRLTSADLKTDHLFTGQLSVGLGGIYSYSARFYSPRLGRFLSADTIVPSWADPQSLNRYSYSINNPLRFTDPTGHSYCDSANAFAEDCDFDKPSKKKTIYTPVVHDLGGPIIETPVGDPNPGGSIFEGPEGGVQPDPPQPDCYCPTEGGALGEPNITVPVGGGLGVGIFMPPGYDGCKDGPLMSSPFGCDGPQIDASSTLLPGPFAGESIGARGPGRDFTDEERKKIDEIGRKTGCHTCGTKDPGTSSGHFIPDHQPPSALVVDGQPQRLYPHCLDCMHRQGGEVLQELRRRQQNNDAAG